MLEDTAEAHSALGSLMNRFNGSGNTFNMAPERSLTGGDGKFNLWGDKTHTSALGSGLSVAKGAFDVWSSWQGVKMAKAELAEKKRTNRINQTMNAKSFNDQLVDRANIRGGSAKAAKKIYDATAANEADGTHAAYA